MPALSPTMSHGNIASWTVSEGDEFSAGDSLAEIETDKATLTWETMDDGVLAKILVPAGAKDVPVGTTLALMCEDTADVPKFAGYEAGGAPAAAAPAAEAEAEAPAAAAAPEAAPSGGAAVKTSNRLGPAARMLMQKHGLIPSQITPTGPRGVITKGDVMAAVAAGVAPAAPAPPNAEAAAAQPKPAAAAAPSKAPAAATPATPPPAPAKGQKYVDIPNSQMRKVIASRLSESKSTIPHLYLDADVGLDTLNAARAALKAAGKKVSVNDFVVRAVALALAEVPGANSYWDAGAGEVKRFPSVDVCVAVATPGGLVTPIVAAADSKSLFQIGDAVRDLAGRARANKLKPEEFMGGSFTISNLGMFGIDKFYAIINPPQACIMAVGGGREVVVMGGGGVLTSTSRMTVTLSADQRVYDGEVAGDFLAAFARHMESPVTMFA